MERQYHGFEYQKHIIDTNKYTFYNKYTFKWDAKSDKYNISIKTAKIKSDICFGDIKRIISTDENFILHVGFWKKYTYNILEEYKILIKKEDFKSYIGDISHFDEMFEEIKNITNDKSDDLKWKIFMKKYKTMYGKNPILSIRFKRDHKIQKRIQCSISYKNVIVLIYFHNLKMLYLHRLPLF